MIRLIATWILGSLILGCALTPALYSLIGALVDPVPWPYSRVFNRVAMLVAAIWLWRMHRALGWREAWSAFREERAIVARIVLAFVLSASIALAALPLLAATGALELREVDPVYLVRKILPVIPAAVLIALLEELFFRAILLRGVMRTLPTAIAVIGTSLFFASLHFLSPDRHYEYPGWSPTVGFEYLGPVIMRAWDPGFAPAFFGLSLIGLALALVYLRGRSLAACVGLHAGWILAAKWATYFTTFEQPEVAASALARRTFLIGQPVAWVAVSLASGLALWWLTRGPRRAESVGGQSAATPPPA